MIRQALLKSAKEIVGTEYNVDLNGTTATPAYAGGPGLEDITYEIEFIVNQDAPDEVIDVFRELVEGDMDDSDNLSAVFNNMMAQALNARLPASQQQNLDEHFVRTWKDYLRIWNS